MKKVYLIRAAQFYKIGISGDVKKRLPSIQTGCPIKCEYVGYFPTHEPEILEKRLHSVFQDTKTFGEWFDLGDDNIELMISEFNLKHSINPYSKLSAATATTSSSKELTKARALAGKVNEIDALFNQFYPGKELSDTGKETVRKLLIAFGVEVVGECLRHLAEKFDSTDVFDKWKNVCKSYQKYGRHVPDNVWFTYFRLKTKLGPHVGIAFIEYIMENELEENSGLCRFIANNVSNYFKDYDGSMWDCIDSYLKNNE